MRTLKDLKLSHRDHAKVKRWLQGWVNHFTDMAEGARETVERYNLKDLDFFYFTDCRDILNKNPEGKGVEDNKKIINRKRAIEYKLIFKKLLGETLGRRRPCGHCGHDDRWIDSLGDGTGHFLYCPKCEMTTIVTYPCGYNTCIEQMVKRLKSVGYEPLKIDEQELDDWLTHTNEEKEEKKCKCKGKGGCKCETQ